MRIKIIAVNALIVAVVGLLSFLLVRSSVSAATSNKDQLTAGAQGDVNGAAGWVQLDGLRAERWLAAVATEPATVDALSKATASARGDAATKVCDDLVSRTKNAPLFERNVPTFVALVDAGGHVVGRNNSNLGRGDDLAGLYSGLKSSLSTGHSGSDVWYEKDRYLASYVVVRDEQAKTIGALVIGRPLDDTLSRVSEATASGRPLILVAPKADGFQVVAHSAQTAPGLDDSINKAAKDTLNNSLSHQETDVVRDGDLLIAGSPLPAFEDGKRALIVAASPGALIPDPTGLVLVPTFGALAIGLVLVIVGGWLLGNYITRPINNLEEGLLAILNGQADKRFELDHAELGGLAFRIDQLLNQLMGVEEDPTDDEGRVSRSPERAGELHRLARGRRQEDGHGRRVGRPRPGSPPRRRAAGPVLRAHLPRVHRGQEGHRRADGPHQRAGLCGTHPEHGTGHGPEVRPACALPGARAEQRSRSSCGPAVESRPFARLRRAARRGRREELSMGLFDLFKGGTQKAEGKPRPKASPAAKWADRVERRVQNYDRQEAIQALSEMGSAEAVEVLLKRFTFHIDPSITDQEEKDSAFRGILRAGRERHRAGAGVRRARREPRVADEDHQEPRRRERVHRGAPSLARQVGHRLRQVRRPEGADPRGARGASATRASARASSGSSRT